ncbi:MAG: hypothetical protein M3387_07950 [Actinomycetota bacterium]|nr:hypothetical protein [Actinomycetota bacterium]
MDRAASAALLGGAGIAVAAGGVAAFGTADGDTGLRSGPVPWALSALAVAVGLVLLGAYRISIGRPRRLAAAGVGIAVAGLSVTAAMLLAIGVSGALGLDALNDGTSAVSTAGTLVASVATLLLAPLGLLLFSSAVLLDRRLPLGVRVMPLVATGVSVGGPPLVAVVAEQGEAVVLAAWVLLMGGAWAAFGVRCGQAQLGDSDR